MFLSIDTLTTLPHFLAAMIAFANGYPKYATVIAAATSASVLMHSTNSFAYLDYALAITWGLTDAYQFQESMAWNALILFLHFAMEAHWQWHLVSAVKASYIALKICI